MKIVSIALFVALVFGIWKISLKNDDPDKFAVLSILIVGLVTLAAFCFGLVFKIFNE